MWGEYTQLKVIECPSLNIKINVCTVALNKHSNFFYKLHFTTNIYHAATLKYHQSLFQSESKCEVFAMVISSNFNMNGKRLRATRHWPIIPDFSCEPQSRQRR